MISDHIISVPDLLPQLCDLLQQQLFELTFVVGSCKRDQRRDEHFLEVCEREARSEVRDFLDQRFGECD